MKFLNNKTILVTGSCGSVGSNIVDFLIKTKCKKIIALDNNEGELFFQREKYKQFKKFVISLTDICDLENLSKITSGVDYIIHCAALKNVQVCEISPSTCVNTNILATSNIIYASRINKVKKVLFTSSDKAVNPTNIMGASKLVAEKLITAANLEFSGKSKTIFSSTRFGNVIGSTGSVIPIFINQIKENKKLTITSKKMTRFMMSNKKSVQLVLNSLDMSRGGEIFITKMPTINIFNLAQCIYKMYSTNKKQNLFFEIIGPKQGEKMYEELMTTEELSRSFEIKDFFIVLPNNIEAYNNFIKKFPQKKIKKVTKVFNSSTEKEYDLKQTFNFLNKILKEDKVKI